MLRYVARQAPDKKILAKKGVTLSFAQGAVILHICINVANVLLLLCELVLA